MTGVTHGQFWLRSAYALGSLLSATALVWIIYLVNRKLEKMRIFVIFFFGFLFAFLCYVDELVIGKIDKVYLGRFVGSTGPMFIFYSIFTTGAIILSLVLLYLAQRSSAGARKMGIKYVFFGALIFSITSITVSFILPLLGIT